MIAVKHLDVDTAVREAAAQFAELAGLVLFEALHEDVAHGEDADAGGFEYRARGGAVGDEEVSGAATVDDPGAAAFDADAAAAEGFAHEREGAGAVFEGEGEVLHRERKRPVASGLGNRGHFGLHRSVDVETQLIAGLMADPSRGRMLASLMDGRARTAKELAFAAGVTAQTVSFHAAKLVGGDVLAVEAQGRHRYFRIARPEVADALEALMTAAGRKPPARAEDAAEENLPPIKAARFCYDHLAGRLGVELLAGLVRAKVLVVRGKDFEVSRRGETKLAEAGIDLARARAARRRFACPCLDWSERRPHLGGALGQAVAERALAAKWIRRREDSRAVTVTERGRREMAARFGIELSA